MPESTENAGSPESPESPVEGYRLSPQQRLLWVRERGAVGTHRVRGVFRLDGPCERRALLDALRTVLDRHEILRTRFAFLPGMDLPIQVIDPTAAVALPEVDLGGLGPERQSSAAEGACAQLRELPFDLAATPALRCCRLTLGPRARLLHVAAPALVADPASLFLLGDEVLQLLAGPAEASELADPPLQYVQFAEWHNELLASPQEGEEEEEGRQFWRQREEVARRLAAPTRTPQRAAPSHRARFRWPLDPGLGTYGADDPEAVPNLLLACWALLHGRLGGAREILVHRLSPGRSFAELEGCLGLLAKYLPTPVVLTAETLPELLAQVAERVAEDEGWQEHFLSTELAGGGLAFSFHRSPAAHGAGDLRLSWERLDFRLEDRDLQLSIDETDGAFFAQLDYDPTGLGRGEALRLAGQLSVLVAGCLRAPKSRLRELPLLSAAERQELLREWNDTGGESGVGSRGDGAEPALLHRRFESQVRRTPDAPAVEHAAATLSYGELDRRARRLAAILAANGVGPERRVGLYLHRGLDLIVGLFATLQAGGAYVPIEATTPPGRLAAILADCRPTLVLTETALASHLPPAAGAQLSMDGDWWRGAPTELLPVPIVEPLPENLAYLIYTSGTTGAPKGVGIPHRAAVNLVLALRQAVYGESDRALRVTLNSPIAFDASVKQILQLLGGHCLHVVPDEVRIDGERFFSYLEERGVDVLDCTPSQLKMLSTSELPSRLPHLLLVGGERMDEPTWRLLAGEEGIAAYNLYGPTECTVDAAVCRVRPGRARPSIGPPIANVSLYVLDAADAADIADIADIAGEPVPVGAVGELCIGGAGLARGYFERPATTAASFVPHPFASEPGARIYRTGDLARIRDHGEIEVLGRRDRQVKLRGFRIELEEIEAVLARHPAVRESAVVATEDATGHPRLVAYVVPARRQRASDSGKPAKRLYPLPNGLSIAHQNRNETEYLYEEIFDKSLYLQHGIALPAEACVFDVGANIGMFSLFAAERSPGARIYAFEPIRPIYEDLRANLERYVPGARVFNFGLASVEREEVFTYFPRYSMMSGQRSYADPEYDREVVKAFLANEQGQLDALAPATPAAREDGAELLRQADDLLRLRFEGEAEPSRLLRLSRVFADEKIERVDLLKIDVQRAELDVLLGIDEADRGKIDQIVMEVHDRPGAATAGRLSEITRLLTESGYEVVSEQDPLLAGTDRYNLYAWLPAFRQSARFRTPVVTVGLTADPDPALAPVSPESLREFLRPSLPEYMVPTAFVLLDGLPLTSGGKVDHRALPAPETASTSPSAVAPRAPRTPRERILTEVWAEALGLTSVSVLDNFFDLGGDSIRSIRVRALAQQRGVLFSAADLLESQTIEELARRAAGPEGTAENAENAEEPAATAPFALLALLAEDDRERLLARATAAGSIAGDIEDAYPLARLQAGMLFHSAADPEGTAYHNVNSLHLRAPYDEERLRQAIAGLLARHPVLRTAFDLTSYGEPLQLVFRHPDLPLTIHDLRHLDEAGQERFLDQVLVDERQRPFDWSRAPLVRFAVHRRGPDTFQLTWAEHHAILDGWSLASMVTELLRDYLSPGEKRTDPVPAVAFRDFIAQERRALSDLSLRRFWSDRLAEAVPTSLPRAPHPGPVPAGRQMRAHEESLPPAFVSGLRELARKAGAPLKSVLLAAHLRVLAAASGRTDALTGLVTNARPEVEGGDRLFGLFLNSLPFHLRLDGGSWLDLVRETFRAEQEVLPYRQYPVAEITEITRQRGGGPLFETLFNYTHFHVLREVLALPGLAVLGRRSIVVDLGLTLVTDFSLSPEASLDLHLAYDARVLPRHQIEALAGAYRRALSAMAETPAASYEASLLLSEAERQQLLIEWNDSGEDPSGGSRLHRLFEQQAARTPQATAVLAPGGRLTYAELQAQANRLAHRLRGLGIGPEKRVGISLDRTPGMVIAVLAVLKAGGAYVPLDPTLPAERLESLVRDAGLALWITSLEWAEGRSGGSLPRRLDPAREDLSGESADDLPGTMREEMDGENLAYVIYTSGSTGQPKGVAIAHRSAVALVSWAVSFFSPSRLAGVLAASGLGFDLAVFEIFAPLACGGAVVLAEHLLELPTLPTAGAVTLLNTVPSLLQELLREGDLPAGITTVTLAGEALPQELVDRLFECTAVREVYNLYGPSEDTTFSTFARQAPRLARGAPGAPPPIGRPLPGTSVFLLDAHLVPVPAGVAGELFLGGRGLARGYLHRPELTAERFVPSPGGGAPGDRLYRTGDLARYRPDGQLEFLGRLDQQVKLRGLRIELGEIEAALTAHPAIRAAAVAVAGQGSHARLVAYVVDAVATGESPTPPDRLRDFLRQRLPEPLVPAHFVPLAALPLTSRGKLDRAALPAVEAQATASRAPFCAPRDRLEIDLAQIWEELLNIAPIGVRDDFFALGGHSILALRLMVQVRQRFGSPLPMAELLRHPTIESLAMALRAPRAPRETGAASSLVTVQPRGSARPLFAVHPIGGNVLCYYGLGRELAGSRPLYAFQARGLEGEESPLRRIEDMAARYVEELEASDPEGPHLLLGWSMGGVVAFEMARQLEQRGQKVALLALLDAPAPPPPGAPPLALEVDPLHLFARELGLAGAAEEPRPSTPSMLELPEMAVRLQRLLEQAKSAGLLPPTAEMPEIQRAFDVFVANLRALEAYRPEAVASCEIILFRADDAEGMAPRDLGWSRWTGGGVEVVPVPGDHYTFLQEGHLRELAERLEARVQAALTGVASPSNVPGTPTLQPTVEAVP